MRHRELDAVSSGADGHQRACWRNVRPRLEALSREMSDDHQARAGDCATPSASAADRKRSARVSIGSSAMRRACCASHSSGSTAPRSCRTGFWCCRIARAPRANDLRRSAQSALRALIQVQQPPLWRMTLRRYRRIQRRIDALHRTGDSRCAAIRAGQHLARDAARRACSSRVSAYCLLSAPAFRF